jgi:hypothetical protein
MIRVDPDRFDTVSDAIKNTDEIVGELKAGQRVPQKSKRFS